MSLADKISSAFDKYAFASYAIVVAVAGKTVWGMWLYRDLTTGDTSSYFVTAIRWFERFETNILWSPLYTSFYGQTLFATHSVYGATTLHRIIIVVAAAVGVLALMRCMLSPGLALLVALWWTILPINFETLYEVHLFALLPMLIVLIVASSGTTPAHRGVILALLLGITVLVRNETSVVLAVFAGFCVFEEVAQPFGKEPRTAVWWRERIAGYTIPLLLVSAVIVFCYARSTIKYPDISTAAQLKHTLNMCQVYAFGYAQREPNFTASPWTECMPLMKQTFGSELPTLFEMLKANPTATFVHFFWNLSLALNGFQVALFNAMSGTVNPDYASVHGEQWYATLLSVIATLVLVGGGWRLWSNWSTLRETLIERRYLVVILVGLACAACLIIMTQRPRPSYLFAFSVCIMGLVGMSADLLTRRFTRQVNIAGLLTGVAILVFLPYYQFDHLSSRPLYTNLTRLQPYQSQLAGRENKILIGDYAGELSNYLRFKTTSVGQSDPGVELSFPARDYSVLTAWDRQESLAGFLESQGFTAIFIQPRVMAELQQVPAANELLEGRSKYKRLNSTFDRDWALFAVVPAQVLPTSGLPKVLDHVAWKSDGIYQDGWLAQNGSIEVRPADAGRLVLRGMVPGGIGIDSQEIEIHAETGTVIRKRLVAGPFEIEIPIQAGPAKLTFAFASPAALPNGDGRIVGALLQSTAIEPR
jgi:hypothetical protein